MGYARKFNVESDFFNNLLKGIAGLTPPYEGEWSKAVYHLYVVRTNKREELKNHLAEKNIDTGLHYPLPLHLQKAYTNAQVPGGTLDVTERSAREILSLPMFPGLTADQQKKVVDGIHGFVKQSA